MGSPEGRKNRWGEAGAQKRRGLHGVKRRVSTSQAEAAPAVQSAKAERPSVLAKLKAPLSQPCAEDKIRHRGKEER